MRTTASPSASKTARSVPSSVAGTVLCLVAPVLVLTSVWAPVISQVRTPSVDISSLTVEAARVQPGDPVLDELRQFQLLPIDDRSPALEQSIAEGILAGRLELPELPPATVSPSFDADELDRLPPALQLWYAGFVVPDFLLAAYVRTGREDFFAAARAFIIAWDQYERGSWLPKGLLWNDHAVAARVRVLVEFWRLLRARPDYDPAEGRAVLEQAARYGYLLASPDHFTFATNHGLMQNLGLLELALAFPMLPNAADYQHVAVERLGEQLTFLVDESGVVRENSAGYQAFDLHLLGLTVRCLSLLGEAIPDELARKYKAGLEVLGRLRRPDGTLPATGDTDAGRDDLPLVTDIDEAGLSGALGPIAAAPPRTMEFLDTGAGYWIHWDGLNGWPDDPGLAQTVVTWTSPPGPGHKHADELSTLIWSDGISWLTSVGYWPYEDPGRGEAESWGGANAPHLADEAFSSDRSVALRWYGSAADLAVVDLARVGPDGFEADRQVIRAGPDTWIVLDFTRAAGSTGARSVWTVSPDVELRPLESIGSYELNASSGTASARLDFVASPGARIETYRGSRNPFAGWQVVDGVPRDAPAIVVDQPADEAWLAVVVTRWPDATSDAQTPEAPVITRVDGPDAWAIEVSTITGGVHLERAGNAITVVRDDLAPGSPIRLDLVAAPAEAGEAASRAAFEEAARAYPAFQPLLQRRTTVTAAIATVGVVQVFVLLLVRLRRRALYGLLCGIGVLGWLALAVGLGAFVLPSWTVLSLA